MGWVINSAQRLTFGGRYHIFNGVSCCLFRSRFFDYCVSQIFQVECHRLAAFHVHVLLELAQVPQTGRRQRPLLRQLCGEMKGKDALEIVV